MGNVFLIQVQEVEGGNTREECERESVGVKGDGSVEWRVGGLVPVVAVDSGTEEEEISASCSSPRWQENKLLEDDGAVMALAGDGESGSVSMPEERVGMVSREAEVERGMADGQVVAAAVDASELAGRSNPVEEIDCDPNSAGGLVVTQNQRFRSSSNSNTKSLNGFKILGSRGNPSGAVPAITEQFGGVCRKMKSVNAIVESLLSLTQRAMVEDVRRKRGAETCGGVEGSCGAIMAVR
ncbi:hypothetical protein V6N13_072420 [Hibiscus sabdariffa]